MHALWRRLALAVMLSAATAGSPHAQPSPTRPSFSVSAELVVVDLVAVDAQGRFVANLSPDEIDLREDGRRQPVQLLQLVGTASEAAAAPASAPASPASGLAPADRLTQAADAGAPASGTAAAPRRLAIVIDALSLSVDAVRRVREALRRAVQDLPAEVPVLLATIGTELVVRQAFTTDRAALATAIGALPPQLDTPASVDAIFDAVDRVCAASVDETPVVEAAIEAGERLVADANARSAATSAALASLVASLGALDGRKHLVFYSAGHAISPVTQAVDAVAAAASACTRIDIMRLRRDASSALGRAATRDASEGLRAVITQANRAQTTFYTLDPSGIRTSAVMPQSRGSARSGGAGALMALPGLRADAGRDYLQGLAAETGGLHLRSNDLGAVLLRASADASQYYLVGYAPPAPTSKPGLRKISLSVKRRGVQVRYRTGYLAPSAPAASDADRAFSAAFAAPDSVTRDDFLVSYRIDQNDVAIEALIPVASVRFMDVDGRMHASFSVHAELSAAEGQRTGGESIPGKDVVLDLTPDEHARMTAAANLRVVLSTPRPPRGRYTLTVVARDSSGWIAARVLSCCSAPDIQGADALPAAPDLLQRAAAYVDQFVARFSNVVVQETMTQALTTAPLNVVGRGWRVPGTTTRRTLTSEFLLVRPAGTVFWLAFRDVVRVDDRVVTEDPDRLRQLFATTEGSSVAAAQRIAADGARHLLAPRPRTMTSPVLALAFLQAHHRGRFRYRLDAARADDAATHVTLRMEEVQLPTLMRTDGGQDLPLRGRFEIDPRTGAVREAELVLRTMGESLTLRTTFAFDARVQAHVPATLLERHVMRDGGLLETSAHYGNLRRFSVQTGEAVR